MTRYAPQNVLEALNEVVDGNPEHIDRRPATGQLVPRYVEHGRPACLVAAVMHRLGLSIGLLRQLDRGAGEPGALSSVVPWSCEHAIRRRFTPTAWEMLAALQSVNDQAVTWRACRANVLSERGWLGRRWVVSPWAMRHGSSIGRPWLTELEPDA